MIKMIIFDLAQRHKNEKKKKKKFTNEHWSPFAVGRLIQF